MSADAAGQQPTGDVAQDEAAAERALIAKTPLGVPWTPMITERLSPIAA